MTHYSSISTFCQADWLAVLAARQVRSNDDNVIIPKLIYRRIILKLSTFPIRKLYENYKHIFIFLEHYSIIKRIGHKIDQPRLVEAKKDLLPAKKLKFSQRNTRQKQHKFRGKHHEKTKIFLQREECQTILQVSDKRSVDTHRRDRNRYAHL